MKTKFLILSALSTITCIAWMMRPLPEKEVSSCCAAPDAPMCGVQKPARARPVLPTGVKASPLPPTAEEHWKKTSPHAPMAAFQAWAADFIAKPDAAKIAEGVKAVTARRVEMKRLIAEDPEGALASAVPEAVRRAMPREVQALLEQKVDARGDLIVTGLSYDEGKLPEGERGITMQAKLSDGRIFDAFTYGRREMQLTQQDVALHGVALDDQMAVSEWPGRVLEPVELVAARAQAGVEPVCEVSELPTASKGTETALIMGTETSIYCEPAHAADTLSAAAFDVAASGDESSLDSSTLSRAPAGWTVGTKRLMVVRLNFTSDAGNEQDYHDLSQADAEAVFQRVSENLASWSYGRLKIAPLGAGGSAVRTVTLDEPAEDFEDSGSDIWFMGEDVWDALEEEDGIDEDDYPFLLLLAGNAPITDDDSPWNNPKPVKWGGIGIIGGGVAITRKNEADWSQEKRIQINTEVALHELGHNFGLRHASSLIAMPADSPIPYTFDEYGDYYDTMGRSSHGRDYNARSKHWLRWLDNASLPVITGSGIFALHEHDLDENGGVRGLQVRTDFSRDDIFIDYSLRGVEPRATPAPYVSWTDQTRAYGAVLRACRRDGPRSWLLDGTPETSILDDIEKNPGMIDGLLLPGRTFGFGNAYITTLAADPVAGLMVVEVQRPVTGNSPPTGSLTQSMLNVSAGTKFLLTAEAADPDGDTLAYHWRVPSFDLETDDPWKSRAVLPNSQTIALSFSDTGDKMVKCLVSDKHGGTVELSKVVFVSANETPTISSILDKTMDEDGVLSVPFAIGDPAGNVESLVVAATSSDESLIHSGSLVITGTGTNRAVSITPTANRHGSATITVSANDGEFTAIEQFKVTVRPTSPGVTLTTTDGDWRYWAAASTPPNSWRLVGYDDSAWTKDNARFIHPAPPSNFQGWTVLPAAPGRITCYFRRSFAMPQFPAGQLMLRMICDDGVVVYVNGIEVARHNMPGGRIEASTRALVSKEGVLEQEIVLIPVPASMLTPGVENTIAVEVHDAGSGRGAGDVEFEMEIAMAEPPLVSSFADDTILEDGTAGPYSFTVEDAESGGGPLSVRVISSDEELFSSAVAQITPAKDPGQFHLTLKPAPNAHGSAIITVQASDGSSANWSSFVLNVTPVNDLPQLASILGRTATVDTPVPLVQLTLADADHDPATLSVTTTSSDQAVLRNSQIQIISDPNPAVRWLQLRPQAGVLGETTVTVTVSDGIDTATRTFILRITEAQGVGSSDVTLLPAGSQWRCSVDEQEAKFAAADFDDKSWHLGTGPFLRSKTGIVGEHVFFNSKTERITTYFRTSFRIGSPTSLSLLRLRMRRDDGAAVYVNGTRVWLSNLPDLIDPQTLALTDIDREHEETWHTLDLPVGYLVPGRNVIAVELHQSVKPITQEEKDLAFDFEITAVPAAATTTPPVQVLVPAGDLWRYWDLAVKDVGAGWRTPGADDSSWSRGFAPLGYGYNGAERTVVNRFNANGQTNQSVLYRKNFTVTDPAACQALHLFMRIDDGTAVYLNGTRVVLQNVSYNFFEAEPDGSPLPDRHAGSASAPGAEARWHHFMIDPLLLKAGTNHLAVSVHQSTSAASQALHFFDLQLSAELEATPHVVTEAKAGQFSMAWSSAYLGWQLQKSSDLIHWTNVGTPLTLDGATLRYQEAIQGTSCFYRLVQP